MEVNFGYFNVGHRTLTFNTIKIVILIILLFCIVIAVFVIKHMHTFSLITKGMRLFYFKTEE